MGPIKYYCGGTVELLGRVGIVKRPKGDVGVGKNLGWEP